jgi:hypothetical protein
MTKHQLESTGKEGTMSISTADHPWDRFITIGVVNALAELASGRVCVVSPYTRDTLLGRGLANFGPDGKFVVTEAGYQVLKDYSP